MDKHPPEWLWWGEVGGSDVVTFGRWPKRGARWRYKLAEIQPTEHDHKTDAQIDAEVDAIMAMSDAEVLAMAKAERIDLDRLAIEYQVGLQVANIIVATQKRYVLEHDDENSNETAIKVERDRINNARRALVNLVATPSPTEKQP